MCVMEKVYNELWDFLLDQAVAFRDSILRVRECLYYYYVGIKRALYAPRGSPYCP